ncbi:NAD(+) synthase [Micromonospora sp. NPDC005652]|uniref:NAD(+) synthase n=1 Tax=Micromonospora sp. NPDC005652 TaxID=3157046 RepID=UPI0033C83C3B
MEGFDPAESAAGLRDGLQRVLRQDLMRRGVVLGVSGGVDSAVCVALAAAALGPERVLGLLMPETDCPDAVTARGRAACEHFGVPYVMQDITATLRTLGCYELRDEAVRRVFPDYSEGWPMNISLGGSADRDRVSYFRLTVQSPSGERRTRRMDADVYRQIVAATNMKQRTRKLVEYLHAESRNFAVLGTPNRLEYDLGFFVRGGDGLADVKPIAHLYKTQVYALARHLGVGADVIGLPPSTDTYSLPQTQEEFYFGVPLRTMDVVLHGWYAGRPAAELAAEADLAPDQVSRLYRDIERKRRVAERGLRKAILLG